MAIELRVNVGEIFSKLIPPPKTKKLPGTPSEILGHEELFEKYRIPRDALNATPMTGVTKFETRDGVILYIDWGRRAIYPTISEV